VRAASSIVQVLADRVFPGSLPASPAKTDADDSLKNSRLFSLSLPSMIHILSCRV
jgi:hypothetical protein